MKNFLTLFLSLLLFVVVDTSEAKSKSYKSYSSKKTTKPFLKKSTPKKPKYVAPKPKPAPKLGTTNKTTKGFGSKTKTDPKLNSPTKTSKAPKTTLDKKLAKKNALLSKNNEAGKKYGSKKAAEAAYKKKMASSNKYTSSTPPATRPDYVPRTVSYNGRDVDVRYNRLSDGSYGYGYYNSSGLFVSLVAAQMIADAAVMSRYGYGNYDAYGNPIYRQPKVVHHHHYEQSHGNDGYVTTPVKEKSTGLGWAFFWLFLIIIVGMVIWFRVKD